MEKRITKIIFLVAESAIEPIPKNLNIPKRLQEKTFGILDSTYHHKYMRNLLKHHFKRGRPDILHRALLTILDSPLIKNYVFKKENINYSVEIYVHTINNEIFLVNPELRIPRHYVRFLGIMSKLFEEKVIISNEGKTLITLLKSSIRDLLNAYTNSKVFVIGYTTLGKPITNLTSYITKKLNQYTILFNVVGGFPKGHFSPNISTYFNDKISISSFPLSTSLTLCRIIFSLEKALKIF